MNDASRDNLIVEVEWSDDELIPFGKYVLLDRISSGATAAVYRANVRGEAGFERLVAIKRILPHMAGDRGFIDTFVREAKIVARMTHSGICPIYELGKVGESLYMAVEYVQGRDLGQVLRRLERRNKSMAPIVTAWISARLCEALDYAHSMKNSKGDNAGIIHRDVSPSNVLVSYEGQVKLIDFGLAKAVGRAQSTNIDALKQKLSYMSPELVKGKAVDARSDIFGLGVCLYEMITGRRLFVGATDVETLKLVSRASVPPPSAVVEDPPDELEMIVMRALEREPQNRYQSAGAMGAALETFIHGADPSFSTSTLSAFMHDLFPEEIAADRQRVTALLKASNDPQLIQQRRTFFASTRGAIARARAEVERRLSTDLPPARDRLQPVVPPAARVPAEALVIPAPIGFDGAAVAQADDVDSEKTRVAPLQLAREAFAETSTPFDEEKTVAAPRVLQEFEEEPTRLVQAGFDEEPTTVFFNKEEGVGMQAIIDEVESPSLEPAGLNLPILSPDLVISEGSASDPRELSQPSYSRRPPPVPYVQAPGTERARITRTRSLPGVPVQTIATKAPTPEANLVAVAAGALLLLLAIIGLIVRTPAGTALGLRAPATGAIEIHSVPEAAFVRLDGVDRGRAPLRMEGVLKGVRQVELRLDGFVPVARLIEVRAGSTAQLSVDLVPARGKPAAAVPSVPPPVSATPEAQPGARVATSQRAAIPADAPRPTTRDTEPGAVRNEPGAGPNAAAEAALTAKRAHETSAATAEHASAANAPPDGPPATQEAAPQTGNEAAAPSTADSNPTGMNVAPYGPAPSRSAEHKVRGARLVDGSPPRSPAADPTQGMLVVYTVPWSLVFIDGQDTGRTTPLVAYPLAAGGHELRLQAASGEVHEQHINVVAGETVRVTRRF